MGSFYNLGDFYRILIVHPADQRVPTLRGDKLPLSTTMVLKRALKSAKVQILLGLGADCALLSCTSTPNTLVGVLRVRTVTHMSPHPQ